MDPILKTDALAGLEVRVSLLPLRGPLCQDVPKSATSFVVPSARFRLQQLLGEHIHLAKGRFVPVLEGTEDQRQEVRCYFIT